MRSNPSETVVFFADYFKVNACLNEGKTWDYEYRECEDNNTEPQIKTVNISNWKTYEDSSYDFKIKYPESWADPQAQVIDDKNFDYQYVVNFGTEKTLNGNDNKGFSILVSKNKTADENIDECDCACDQLKVDSNQENYIAPTSSYILPELKAEEDYNSCYFYQFMGEDYEYKLIPILSSDSNSSPLENDGLNEFELAKNTFTVDYESVQQKAIKLEEERLAAIERARQAEIARLAAIERARQASLRSCPHPDRKPSYSDTKGKHMDEDCCPDPDEWPNPKCRYSAKDYSIMRKAK